MNNITTSIVSFNQTEGTNVATSVPSVSLILTPDAGYSIDYNNFSLVTPSPEFSVVTFTQSGYNVVLNAIFVDPYIMPSANTPLPLQLNGFASLVSYSVSGKILSANTCNIEAFPGTYAATGNYNTTLSLLNIPIKAVPGYYFTTLPLMNITIGDASNYTTTYTKTFDISGNLIQVDYSLGYTFPNANVVGDEWEIDACAYSIYEPVKEITAYRISTSNISDLGETRAMSVFGNEGAVFTVAMDSINLVTNISMGPTGVYTFDIEFPSVVANTTYSIEITGDLAASLAQPNPFLLQQLIDIDVTFALILPAGINAVSSVVKSFPGLSSPTYGSAAYNISFVWNLTPVTLGDEISIVAQPEFSDWSNTDNLLNGGTTLFPGSLISLGNPALSGSLTVSGTIEDYGVSNMTTTLDLTPFIAVTSPSCILYELNVLVSKDITFTYTDCGGTTVTITLNGNNVTYPSGALVCSSVSPTTPATPSSYEIAIGGSC